jgi:hypothetical protein
MATARAAGGSGTGARNVRRIEASFASWEDFLAARLDVMPAGLFLAG